MPSDIAHRPSADHRRHRRSMVVAFLSAVAVAGSLSACSKSNDTASTGAGTSAPSSASAPTAAPGGYGAAATPGTTAKAATGSTAAPGGSGSATTGAVTVKLTDSSLGRILVDDKGNTLYVFMQDTPGKSACNGSCASLWPVLAGSSVKAGDGLDASAFSTVMRSDGSSQIAFHGRPLYYYAKDTKAGDTTGQGVGSVWYVVDKDGNPVDE